MAANPLLPTWSPWRIWIFCILARHIGLHADRTDTCSPFVEGLCLLHMPRLARWRSHLPWRRSPPVAQRRLYMSKTVSVIGPPFGSEVRLAAWGGELPIGSTTLRASAAYLTRQSIYLSVWLKENWVHYAMSLWSRFFVFGIVLRGFNFCSQVGPIESSYRSFGDLVGCAETCGSRTEKLRQRLKTDFSTEAIERTAVWSWKVLRRRTNERKDIRHKGNFQACMLNERLIHKCRLMQSHMKPLAFNFNTLGCISLMVLSCPKWSGMLPSDVFSLVIHHCFARTAPTT